MSSTRNISVYKRGRIASTVLFHTSWGMGEVLKLIALRIDFLWNSCVPGFYGLIGRGYATPTDNAKYLAPNVWTTMCQKRIVRHVSGEKCERKRLQRWEQCVHSAVTVAWYTNGNKRQFRSAVISTMNWGSRDPCRWVFNSPRNQVFITHAKTG